VLVIIVHFSKYLLEILIQVLHNNSFLNLFIGSRRMVDVMECSTQKNLEMSMKDWQQYYDNPDRVRLLNVISLEFSHTKLEHMVHPPRTVKIKRFRRHFCVHADTKKNCLIFRLV